MQGRAASGGIRAMVARGVTLASVSILAMLLAPSARAADLPSAEQGGTWTGFYLGTYVGSAWIDTHWGPANGGLMPTSVPPGSNMGSAPGAMIGTQVGYNYQLGSYVLGVEGELGSGLQWSRTRCMGDWASVCT